MLLLLLLLLFVETASVFGGYYFFRRDDSRVTVIRSHAICFCFVHQVKHQMTDDLAYAGEP